MSPPLPTASMSSSEAKSSTGAPWPISARTRPSPRLSGPTLRGMWCAAPRLRGRCDARHLAAVNSRPFGTTGHKPTVRDHPDWNSWPAQTVRLAGGRQVFRAARDAARLAAAKKDVHRMATPTKPSATISSEDVEGTAVYDLHGKKIG